MKKLSKRSKLILGFLAAILVFLGYYSHRIRFWEDNVFEQMYYSRVHDGTGLAGEVASLGYFRTLFSDMPQIETPRLFPWFVDDTAKIELFNTLFETYHKEYLEDNHYIGFMFLVPEPIMYIEYKIFLEDDQGGRAGYELYGYCYNADEKTLTYYTSDPENTEMKNFLFDRVLPDWFAANKWRTRFSSENLGKYTLIDTTVEVQYENYSIEEKQIAFDDVFISYPVFVSDGSPFEDAVNALLLEELCLGQDEEELRNYKGCQVFDGSYTITFANEDIVSICLHLYAIQGLGPGIEYWKGVTFSISEQRFLRLSDLCTWEDLVQCMGTPEDLLESVPELWRSQYVADELPSEIDWDGEHNFYLGSDYVGLTLLNVAASPLETVVFEVPFDWTKKGC